MRATLENDVDLAGFWTHLVRASDDPVLGAIRSTCDWNTAVLEPMRIGGAAAMFRGRDGRAVAITSGGSSYGAGTWRVLSVEDDTQLESAAVLSDLSELTRTAMLDRIDDVQVVSYRPTRRAVLRVRGFQGDRRVIRYIKLLRASAYRRAVQVYAALPQETAHAPHGLVHPIAFRAECNALVFDEVAGQSLHDWLRIGGSIDMQDLVAGIGTIQRLQPRGKMPVTALEHIRGATIKMLERGSPFLPELNELTPLVRRLPLPLNLRVGVVHGDLHDKQIFVNKGITRVIDGEGTSVGPVLFDVVNVAEHFRLRSLQWHTVASDLADAVIRQCGFDPYQKDTRRLRILVISRLAGVYACRPRWWGVARKLTRTARALLEVTS